MASLFIRLARLPRAELSARLNARLLATSGARASARGKGDAYAPPTVDPASLKDAMKTTDSDKRNKSGKEEVPHFLSTSLSSGVATGKSAATTTPSVAPGDFDATKYKNEPKETDNDYLAGSGSGRPASTKREAFVTPKTDINLSRKREEELAKSAERNKLFPDEPKETDNDYLAMGTMDRPAPGKGDAYAPPTVNPQAIYQQEDQEKYASKMEAEKKWNEMKDSVKDTVKDVKETVKDTVKGVTEKVRHVFNDNFNKDASKEWREQDSQAGYTASSKKGWARSTDAFKDAEEKDAVHHAFSEGLGGATQRADRDEIPPSSNLAAERRAAESDFQAGYTVGNNSSNSSKSNFKDNSKKFDSGDSNSNAGNKTGFNTKGNSEFDSGFNSGSNSNTASSKSGFNSKDSSDTGFDSGYSSGSNSGNTGKARYKKDIYSEGNSSFSKGAKSFSKGDKPFSMNSTVATSDNDLSKGDNTFGKDRSFSKDNSFSTKGKELSYKRQNKQSEFDLDDGKDISGKQAVFDTESKSTLNDFGADIKADKGTSFDSGKYSNKKNKGDAFPEIAITPDSNKAN